MNITDTAKSNMSASLKKFEQNLEGLYVGKVSPNILAPISVQVHGTEMVLPHLATLSLSDPRTIRVDVWDPSLVKSVDKAIRESILGFNPRLDGNTLYIAIAAPTGEQRELMVKNLKSMGEKARVVIRNHRRDANILVTREQTSKDMPEHTANSIRNKIQIITDGFVDSINKIVADKEKEILGI